MIKLTRKIYFEPIILGIVILFGFLLRLYSWSYLGNLSWDEASHSLAGIMLDYWLLHGFNFSYLSQFMSNYWATTGSLFFFPWGYTALSAISFLLFGFSELAARVPSMIFSLLIILATYLLAQKLFNKKIGLIAGFLAAINPWFILWGNQALPDLPMTCLMILAIYFCLEGIARAKIKYWIFAGLSAGLAGLMKPTGFIIFPFLMFIVIYDQGFKYLFKKQFLILTLIGLTCFLSYFGFGLAAVSILPKLKLVTPEFGWHIFKNIFQWFGRILPEKYFQLFGQDLIYAKIGDPNWRSFGGWLYYFKLIPKQLGGYLIAVFSLIGIIKLFFDKNSKNKFYFIITFIIFIYLIFTFIANKDSRYTLPYLPFIFILASIGISYLTSLLKLKQSLLVLLIVLTLVFASSFNSLIKLSNFSDNNLETVIEIITNSKPGLVVPLSEDNDINVQTISFYLALKDSELRYRVYWPTTNNPADYIIAQEKTTIDGFNLKYANKKLYLYQRN